MSKDLQPKTPGLVLRTLKLFVAGKELLTALAGVIVAITALMGSSESNLRTRVSYKALATKVNHISERLAHIEGQLHFLSHLHPGELQKMEDEMESAKDELEEASDIFGSGSTRIKKAIERRRGKGKKMAKPRPRLDEVIEEVEVTAMAVEEEDKKPESKTKKGSAFIQMQQQDPGIPLPDSLDFVMNAQSEEVQEQIQDQNERRR